MPENTYSFRTALGGFHRGDVSEYIASTAAAHQARIDELQEQIQRLERENESLRSRLETLPEEAVEETDVEVPEGDMESRELAAYRRAEAVERLANQRARKLYADMQEICDNSMQEFQDSSDVTRSAADSISRQLDVIRASVESVFASLGASSEKLRAAAQFSPDPAEELEEE